MTALQQPLSISKGHCVTQENVTAEVSTERLPRSLISKLTISKVPRVLFLQRLFRGRLSHQCLSLRSGIANLILERHVQSVSDRNDSADEQFRSCRRRVHTWSIHRNCHIQINNSPGQTVLPSHSLACLKCWSLNGHQFPPCVSSCAGPGGPGGQTAWGTAST